jgi:DNA polymerase III delta prime subunit
MMTKQKSASDLHGPPIPWSTAARALSASAIRDGYQPAGLHVYRDADGAFWFARIRCKHPDGRKWIRPMCRAGFGYVIGEPSDIATRKPLYRLNVIARAGLDAPVFLVEGENCADQLAQLGILATTAGSASSDDKADFAPLAGRSVTLWPDNDLPGKLHMARVAEKLAAVGSKVQIVDSAALSLPDKGDVVDWLKANPEASAADVLALPTRKTGIETYDTTSTVPHGPQVELLRGDQITLAAVDWLWQGWLAHGKLHVLAGAPGTGKTTIAMALAAAVTCSGKWPDGSPVPGGDVLIWSGEDDPSDTLAPRLVACGADLKRVHFIKGATDASGGSRSFNPATDMPALMRVAAELPRLRLLILDPIVNAMGAADSHKNAEVRAALAPVVDLAGSLSVAALGISHFTKGTQGRDPVERVTGSLAFGALPRVVLATAKVKRDDGTDYRLLARAKSNIGPDDGGFTYRLEQVDVRDGISASCVTWGAPVKGSARELLSDAEEEDPQSDEGRTTADWLRDLLREGSMRASEVKAAAAEAGMPWRTVQRAMSRVGESVRSGFGRGAGYVWRMRANTSPCAPCAPDTECGAHGAHEGQGRVDGFNGIEI